MTPYSSAFWSVTPAELLHQLQTTTQGMTNEDAQERLVRYGANVLKTRKQTDTLTLLLAQFKSPLVLLLLFAAGFVFRPSRLRRCGDHPGDRSRQQRARILARTRCVSVSAISSSAPEADSVHQFTDRLSRNDDRD